MAKIIKQMFMSIEEYFDTRVGSKLSRLDLQMALDRWRDFSTIGQIRHSGACTFCTHYMADMCIDCPLNNGTCSVGEARSKDIIFSKFLRAETTEEGKFYAKQIYNEIAKFWNKRYPNELVKLYRVYVKV